MQQESNSSYNDEQCCQKKRKPLVKQKAYFFTLVTLGAVLVTPIDKWGIHIDAQVEVADKQRIQLIIEPQKPNSVLSKPKKQ